MHKSIHVIGWYNFTFFHYYIPKCYNNALTKYLMPLKLNLPPIHSGVGNSTLQVSNNPVFSHIAPEQKLNETTFKVQLRESTITVLDNDALSVRDTGMKGN